MIIDLLRLLIAGISLPLWANPKLIMARQDLTKMDQQMAQIKENLLEQQNLHLQLAQKLKKNEKKIAANQQQADAINEKILELQAEIQTSKQKIALSKAQIAQLTPKLQQHLNLHLYLAQQPLWQLALNADNPFAYQQKIELIKCLHQAEQQKIQALAQARALLQKNQTKMKVQNHRMQQLRLALLAETKSIRLENQQNLNNMQTIKTEIDRKTQTLHILKQHQANLKHLIQHLLQENTLQSPKPFSSLKRNLNTPIYQNLPQALNLDHGLLFPAPLHSPVYAVSSGKIVFADWLNGYGYLIILDHGWGFMSLYGNNASLLKHKGDLVKQGELLAKSGDSGSFKKQGLYFEIRQRTKVISARAWFKTHMA